MPHSVRQEYKIDIAGRTFTMRPTFIGLDKLETYLGLSIFQWANACMSGGGQMKLMDLVMCIQCGVYGDLKDRTPTVEELGELVVEQGPMSLVPLVIEFVMTALLDEEQAAAIYTKFHEDDKDSNASTGNNTAKKQAAKKKKKRAR